MKRETAGMALALALLLLLALTALAHGTLVLAQREMRTSWAFRHAGRAGEASEAAVRLVLRETEAFSGDRQAGERRLVVSGETGDGLGYEGYVQWLNREFLVIEGLGVSRGWRGGRRSAWVGWSLSPGVRLAAFRAVAEIGGAAMVASADLLNADDPTAPPEGWTDLDCDAYASLMDSLYAGGGLLPWGSVGEAETPTAEGDSRGPALGLLSLEELLRRSGAAPGSTEVGSVPSSPMGADSVAGCPGIGGPVFWGVDGSLALEEGRACGLLVVAQDLRLGGSADFQGLVLVGGTLTVEGGAGLEGMARVGGDLRVVSGGHVTGSFCPFLRALGRIDALTDPVILPQGYRLNAY